MMAYLQCSVEGSTAVPLLYNIIAGMVDKKFQAERELFPFLQIAENILFHTRRFVQNS